MNYAASCNLPSSAKRLPHHECPCDGRLALPSSGQILRLRSGWHSRTWSLHNMIAQLRRGDGHYIEPRVSISSIAYQTAITSESAIYICRDMNLNDA